jgi:small-conductance mechanosensitive channel
MEQAKNILLLQPVDKTKTSFYHKKGQTQGAVGAVIGLIIGIGVSVLVLIFVGVLAGQAYNIAEDDLDNISNAVIRAHIDGAIISGFEALEDTGSYLPLIVLGIVIFLVLSLVLGISALAQGGGGFRGSAL